MNKYEELFNKQKSYFNTNITRSYEWRLEQLDRMEHMLKENDKAFFEAMGKDFRTSVGEQVQEWGGCFGSIEHTRAELKKWMEPTQVALPKFLADSGHTGTIYRDPYGVTLIIGPFNGPVVLLLLPAVTALSAGNTVVLKTNIDTPATGALLAELVAKYFEPEVLTTVSGDVEVVTELLKIPFNFIFFTGSTRVGKIIMKAAAENLTPVLLELGGQNPVLVDQTANIPDAARKIVWGATTWAGQFCASPGYAYVHESVAAEFVEEAKKALLEMYGPDPKSNPEFSKIINAKAVKRLAALIDPEKVIAGGQSDEEARYMAPTLLYPISWDDQIMREEIFGPILPILTYSDVNEAYLKMQQTERPLTTYIFSQDEATIELIMNGLTFGGGAVNQVNAQLFISTLPFGGVGNAGMGQYYTVNGFNNLTHAKSVLTSPADVAIEHLIPPYTREKIEALSQWSKF
ncbi:MAG: aldehyde dehydrogenase family protein [Bacteroidota bacterium]|nr:aldehyde dehydrogenase family protein [Bacteroidota bacterium]